MRVATKSAPKLGTPKRPPGQIVDPEQVRAWVEDGKPMAVIDAIVTPAVARVLLSYNETGVTNRRMSKTHLEQTKRAVASENWENTGEPVIVSNERLLNDGQTRLNAVVESGHAAVMDLRFGVERRAMAATNSGRKRQAGDGLRLLGAHNHFLLAAAARLLIAYNDGLPGSITNTYSNLEIIRACERWPELEAATHVTAQAPLQFRHGSTGVLAFFGLRTANEASVLEFFNVLRTGEGKASDPPHRLREYLLRFPPTVSKKSRASALAAGILAWNAWRSPAGSIGSLRWRDHHPFPTVDGLVL